MKNSNANNTILFVERKKEFENNKNNNEKDNKIVIKDKNSKVISLSTYKRLKFKKNHSKKDFNFNTNKMKKKTFLIVILALFLLIFATTIIKQKSYSETPSNTFVAQNYKISQEETSTYKSIIINAVNKYTNTSYDVSVSNLHQNGNVVYAQGYFDVPNEGKVNYDLILKNNSPTSLTINGNEYVK